MLWNKEWDYKQEDDTKKERGLTGRTETEWSVETEQICLTGTEMAEIEVTGPKFYCKHVNFPPQKNYHLNQSLGTSSWELTQFSHLAYLQEWLIIMENTYYCEVAQHYSLLR